MSPDEFVERARGRASRQITCAACVSEWSEHVNVALAAGASAYSISLLLEEMGVKLSQHVIRKHHRERHQESVGDPVNA